MGVLTKAVAGITEQRSVTSAAKPASWLLDALGGGATKSGTRVSEETAARLSTVFSCVRIVSEDVGRLPMPLYERQDRGRRRATDHRLWGLITSRANPDLTAKAFRELITGHCALWGGGYAEIELDNAGRPLHFWPLLPNVTRMVRRGGRKYLVTRVTDGKSAGRDVALPPGRYLHIPGPAWMGDGLDGNHPIRMAREAIGLAMAAEEFGARLFGNGARPSGILTTEKKLGKDGRRKLAKQWESTLGGLSNAQRTAVLEENMKWQAITINPDDAQSLETRKFQVEEVARYYRMPLVLLGHTEKATSWGTGIESFMRGYLTQTLGAWLSRWEDWLPFHLFDERELTRFYVEHILEDFLKGDTKGRFEAYAQAVQNGWMSRNEVRQRENMNPIDGEGGDAYTVQLNMAELGQVAGDAMTLRSDGRTLSVGRLEDVVRRGRSEASTPGPLRIEVEDQDVGSVLVTECARTSAVRISWTSLAGVHNSEPLALAAREPTTDAFVPGVVAQAEAIAREKSRQLVKAKRSLTARRRLRRRFEDVFAQVFGRATRREAAALRRLAKRLDSDGEDRLSPEAFVEEVADFFELAALRAGREISGHAAWLAREYSGPLEAFAELVQDEVLEERDVDEKPESAETEVFLSAYVARFLRRHAARSTNQMRNLATRPETRDEEAEAPPTATEIRERVEARLEEWEEKRPEKLAAEESRHSEGSISRITYFAVGVISLEWVAFGENCPLCDELNGQVVGIQDVFLKKGDVVDPDDGETQPLQTRRAILHPPLHLGCDCSVTAG